jgi:hypothetical protein
MKRKLFKGLIFSLITASFISLIGCNSSQSNSTSASGDKTTQENKAAKKLSKEEVEKIYTSPEKYKGYEVDIYARIFADVERDEKGTYIQAFADPKNSTKNTLIAINDPKLDVKEGDVVHVVGVIDKKYEGQNAFGATITAPVIVASKIEKSDYATAFLPAIKTIEVNKEQNQSGYIIKISKVELAKEETRVYVTVTNKMENKKINFYTFNTTIVQGSKQFKEETNFEADYPRMESELLPGVSESGLIAFNPTDVNGENLKIVLEGSCEDYNVKINPFTFEIPLK